MLLDFDPHVVGFASQPFWLSWPEGGRVRSHAPDFFARLDDGTGVVVDCRPAKRVRPQDAAAFRATERACAEVGWHYRLAVLVEFGVINRPRPLGDTGRTWQPPSRSAG